MIQAKNFIVLLDDIDKSKFAIQRIIEFASKQKNTHLYFIKVVDSFFEIKKALNKNTSHIEKIFLREMKEKISVISPDTLKNLTMSFQIKEGVSFIEVIRQVILYKSDLLIIPEFFSSTQNGFASNIFHIIRKCPCPVWVLRASKPKVKLRVLIATDIDQNDPVKASINNKCITLALLLANSQNACVDIVHAWSLRNEFLLRTHLHLAHHKIDIMVAKEEEDHKEWFKSFIEKQKKIPIRKSHFIKGDATQIIPQIIKEEKINLLIMGTIGSISTPGLLISNRAETILQNISCSVIAVKPDGFISPIRIT